MVFEHFSNRNPIFVNSGNLRDLTVSFSKPQGLKCNFAKFTVELRRKIPCLAGEGDPGTVTPPQAPELNYISPGICSCNQIIQITPDLAGN